MRLAILAAGLMAAMPAMPASAVTTVLDFSGNICGVAGDQACSNASSIGQTYGSTADVSVLWRGRTGPGNTSVSTPYVLFWSDAYADLLGVAYAGTTGEATFTVAPGKTLSLDSVDVGGWPFANRFSGVRVYDLDWNLVFDTDAIVFPGTTAATIAIGKSSTAGLIFQWGPDAFNGGIDNLTFTVRDSGPVIPEPGTWAMMIAGFGLVGAAARRRKIATA